MTEEEKVITRRHFLKTGVCVAAGSLMGLPILDNASVTAEQRSRVALVRDMDVFTSTGAIRPDVLENMLE